MKISKHMDFFLLILYPNNILNAIRIDKLPQRQSENNKEHVNNISIKKSKLLPLMYSPNFLYRVQCHLVRHQDS
jgi:hypothetical protein